MKYYILYKIAPAGIAYAVTTEPATAARHGWIATEFPACESAADAWRTIAAYQAGAPQDPHFYVYNGDAWEMYHFNRFPGDTEANALQQAKARAAELKPTTATL